MKRLIPLFIVLVLLGVANAQLGGGHSLLISDLTTTPKEIHPGDNITLSFTVRNTWDWFGSIEDTYVHLEGGTHSCGSAQVSLSALKGLALNWSGGREAGQG